MQNKSHRAKNISLVENKIKFKSKYVQSYIDLRYCFQIQGYDHIIKFVRFTCFDSTNIMQRASKG